MTAAAGGRIALGIMCKAPIEGASKTRLCPPLKPDEAAALSRCFIADTAAAVAAAAGPGVGGVAVFTPADAEAAVAPLLPGDFTQLAQRGTDLGERLLNATADLLERGYDGVCLINSDSPTLPVELLSRTIDLLRRPGDRVVLGPAIDGGYYLIALKRPHPAVFRDIAWSTQAVLAQTLARAAASGVAVVSLPLWYDVDEAASLRLLSHELFGHGIGIGDGLTGSAAPNSRRYLAHWLSEAGADRSAFARPGEGP
jgi:hypothetical protein